MLQQSSDTFNKKEAFIQQMKVCSSLLLTMEENAFLFAEVTSKPEILMESSYNVCKGPVII